MLANSSYLIVIYLKINDRTRLEVCYITRCCYHAKCTENPALTESTLTTADDHTTCTAKTLKDVHNYYGII